jgi:penicillin-binding protein 2
VAVSPNRYLFPGVEVKARLFRQYPLGASPRTRSATSTASTRPTSKHRGPSRTPTTRAPTTSARPAWSRSTSSSCTARPATRRSRSTPAAAPCAACRAPRRFRQQPDADARHQTAGDHRKGLRRPRGALVAIEPSTGGILALVSTPTFDPNLFVDGIRTEDWDLLNNSPDKPMVNRALNGAYPPGSTFKPFMALAALELGKRTPQQAISDPGFFNFGGHHLPRRQEGRARHRSTCTSRSSFLRHLLLHAGQRHGHRQHRPLHGPARALAATGVDIEGESEGVLPSPEWKKRASSARAAEMVCRRNDLDRHRPGLQRLHADPAGAGDGGAGQQRRDVPSRTWSSTSPTARPASGR